jgi:hypothetical protein
MKKRFQMKRSITRALGFGQLCTIREESIPFKLSKNVFKIIFNFFFVSMKIAFTLDRLPGRSQSDSS